MLNCWRRFDSWRWCGNGYASKQGVAQAVDGDSWGPEETLGLLAAHFAKSGVLLRGFHAFRDAGRLDGTSETDDAAADGLIVLVAADV
jgi:hypothetical protein